MTVPSAGVRGEHFADAPEQVRAVRALLRLRTRAQAGLRPHLQAHRRAERRHEAEGELFYSESSVPKGNACIYWSKPVCDVVSS